MKQSTFMAWITRLPLLKRWALMHCFQEENVSEHCHQVAVIAHLLVVIKNTRFGGTLNPEKAATLALYHEVSETKLQDINSNTKYHNPEFTKALIKRGYSDTDIEKILGGNFLRVYRMNNPN